MKNVVFSYSIRTRRSFDKRHMWPRFTHQWNNSGYKLAHTVLKNDRIDRQGRRETGLRSFRQNWLRTFCHLRSFWKYDIWYRGFKMIGQSHLVPSRRLWKLHLVVNYRDSASRERFLSRLAVLTQSHLHYRHPCNFQERRPQAIYVYAVILDHQYFW